jgi:hypothetical protein
MTRPSIVIWLGVLISAPLLFATGADPPAPAIPATFIGPPSPATPPEQLLAVRLFTSIADSDHEALRLALNAGADPNCELPRVPEATALRQRYAEGALEYYFRREPGYTALMFAAALGNHTAARYLLLAGADRQRLSRHSKTFALWQAARNAHLPVMMLLMDIVPGSEPTRYRVLVDLATQKATVWKDRMIVFTTPISSGKPSTPTPPGRYLVTNKYRDWKSTLFPARMPHFLRLSCGDFGLHAGELPGYPASHGCVRVPADNARQLFALLPVGTLVEIR